MKKTHQENVEKKSGGWREDSMIEKYSQEPECEPGRVHSSRWVPETKFANIESIS